VAQPVSTAGCRLRPLPADRCFPHGRPVPTAVGAAAPLAPTVVGVPSPRPVESHAGTDRFDAAYYRRFYGRSPVHDARRIAHLANGVLGFAAWWRVPVRSVLDVGAGKGYWRDWLAEHRPSVRYHGIDVSEHACAT
jgi:hypothetical protein